MQRWKFLVIHFFPSVLGFAREFLRSPRGAVSLLRARGYLFATQRLLRSTLTGDNYLIETPGELISYWSFFVERECWSPEWVTALIEERTPLIIDVGANAGLFTHLVCTINPSSQVIAFEPLPEMANKIGHQKARTGMNVIVHDKAVSNVDGTSVLYASSANDTDASLIYHAVSSQPISVGVVKLDSVIDAQRIFLIKIDVQGCENEVVAGGTRTLNHAKFLLIEISTAEALAQITQQLGNRWRRKRLTPIDYLFIRSPE